MEFVETFLKEKNRKLVSRASKDDMEVLLWAFDKGYVLLLKAPSGALTYSDEDLEKAKMWRLKDET